MFENLVPALPATRVEYCVPTRVLRLRAYAGRASAHTRAAPARNAVSDDVRRIMNDACSSVHILSG